LIEALGAASGFQHLPQFEAFCEYADETFPNNPEVLSAVAGGRMYFSQWDRASDALERQLAIKPDDGVRRQLSVAFLKQLRPDDARPHLQHIFDGKLADQSGYVWLLSEGYSAVGNHHEARDTLRALAEIDPAVANDKEYKKRLAAAEKLAGKGSTKSVASTLLGSPKGASFKEGSRFQLSRWVGPLVALGLATLYFWSAISNGQARKVWVVSGLPVAYTAKVGGLDVELPPFGRVERTFPEGSIHVEVADPKLGIEPADAVVETNFFARPFLSPTFIVNPDRAALVVWEKAHYAANPADAPPNEHKLAGNRVVHEFSSVSHVFEGFPQQIKVEGKKGTRTRVGTLAPPELPQEMMAFAALSMLGPEDGKAVVWRWAYAQPDNEVFLGIVANRAGDAAAAEQLKPRLADRPVLVEWHRAYQNLKDKDPGLVAEYEGYLAKEPDNGELAYLLGRIVEEPAKERELFQRAANGKPPSAYAWNALALTSLARGEFEQGLEQSEKARELLPGRRGFGMVYEDACLALGQWKRLSHVFEHGEGMLPKMPDAQRSPRELQFLIWDDSADGAERLRQTLRAAAQAEGMTGEVLIRREAELEKAMRVARGDWEWVEQHLAEPNAQPSFEELLLVKRYADAAAALDKSEESPEKTGPANVLLSLLAGQAGDETLARTRMAAGVVALAAANRNFKPFVGVLDPAKGAAPADMAELMNAPLSTADKCVLLTAVAKKYPDRATDLMVLARKLNFHRDIQARVMEGLLAE
jgi:tetratricopeptide (TPR) repeat protein